MSGRSQEWVHLRVGGSLHFRRSENVAKSLANNILTDLKQCEDDIGRFIRLAEDLKNEQGRFCKKKGSIAYRKLQYFSQLWN